jgi:hypothetical protein
MSWQTIQTDKQIIAISQTNEQDAQAQVSRQTFSEILFVCLMITLPSPRLLPAID